MPRYQIPERKRRKIVSLFEISYSPPAIRRFFRRNYPRARVPSIRAIERLGAKFRNNGIVKNLPSSGPPCTVVNEENALAIQEIHMDDPSVSTRKLSQMIEISQSSVCKILKNILKSYPYRITLCHQIKDDDYPKRVQYAQIMSVMYADQNFKNNIWYMDEAAFHAEIPSTDCLATKISRYHSVGFLLLGFLKRQRIPEPPPFIASLKDSMIDISNSIPWETFQAVTSQVIVRLQNLIEVNGRQIEL